MDDAFLTSPRVEGIKEQFERAASLLEEARSSGDCLFRFRHLVAAIYPARAVVELMLESADKQEIPESREVLEELLIEGLPRYHLVEKMRIHDFHRFGLRQQQGMFLGGPLKLQAAGKGGTAAIFGTGSGFKQAVSKGSTIKEQRTLQSRGEEVFDESVDQWVSVQTVLDEFLTAMPTIINLFMELCQAKTKGGALADGEPPDEN